MANLHSALMIAVIALVTAALRFLPFFVFAFLLDKMLFFKA